MQNTLKNKNKLFFKYYKIIISTIICNILVISTQVYLIYNYKIILLAKTYQNESEQIFYLIYFIIF